MMSAIASNDDVSHSKLHATMMSAIASSSPDSNEQLVRLTMEHCKRNNDVDGTGSLSSGSATRCPSSPFDDQLGSSVHCDDDEGSNGSKGSPDQQGEDADADGNFPSLSKDGAAENHPGNAGHPNACTPCSFYCFSLRGCRNGSNCSFCHLYHESKVRERRDEWKKSQREKRGRQRKERAIDGSFSPNSGANSNVPVFSPNSQTSSNIPGANSNVPVSPQSTGSRPVAAGESCTMPDQHVVAGAPTRFVAEPSVALGSQSPAPRFQPSQVPWKNDKNSGNSPNAEAGLVAPSFFTDRNAPMHVQLYPQQQPPAPDACSQHAPLQYFAYTPNNVVSGVGQMIELWPPQEIFASDMVFAVYPALPHGLVLDERVGLIHGRPWVCSEQLVTYFVTAYARGDPTMSVKMSTVSLKIVEQRETADPPPHRSEKAARPHTNMKKVSKPPGLEQQQQQQQYQPGAVMKLAIEGARREQLLKTAAACVAPQRRC